MLQNVKEEFQLRCDVSGDWRLQMVSEYDGSKYDGSKPLHIIRWKNLSFEGAEDVRI